MDELTLEDDDDGAINASTLGQWYESDLQEIFDYEWHANEGDEDPNNLDPRYEYAGEVPLVQQNWACFDAHVSRMYLVIAHVLPLNGLFSRMYFRVRACIFRVCACIPGA